MYLSFPLEDPAFVWLTYRSLFIEENEVGEEIPIYY